MSLSSYHTHQKVLDSRSKVHTNGIGFAEAFSPKVPELSIVIPVYNGSSSISPLVERIHAVFKKFRFEVILVNDGSRDSSEKVCSMLAEQYPETVIFAHLAKNFGEHNAVLAGLNLTTGEYVAVLDDDGQNPPEEVIRMLEEARQKQYDVVYGHYLIKQHSWFRNLGSRFNDRMATLMLRKPADLYLSSFKVMNRFIVDQIIKYEGPFPYIDGLIYRATDNIGQIFVEHREQAGESRYNFRKLVALWLNMFLNFSITPLRISSYLGILTSGLSVLFIIYLIIDKIWITQDLTLGIRTTLASICFFAGIQLLLLGLLGEYLGRLFLDKTGTPQFVVRRVMEHRNGRSPEARSVSARIQS